MKGKNTKVRRALESNPMGKVLGDWKYATAKAKNEMRRWEAEVAKQRVRGDLHEESRAKRAYRAWQRVLGATCMLQLGESIGHVRKCFDLEEVDLDWISGFVHVRITEEK